jgi:hypothetical protein
MSVALSLTVSSHHAFGFRLSVSATGQRSEEHIDDWNQ